MTDELRVCKRLTPLAHLRVRRMRDAGKSLILKQHRPQTPMKARPNDPVLCEPCG